MNNRNTSNGAEIPETVTIEQIHQKHQQQISLIEQKHAETLNRLIWNYERQLKEKQKGLESVLSESEILSQKTLQKELSELKSSWTWRIGFFQTSTIRLIINFLKNPYLFVISKRYRWKNIFFYFDIPKIQPPEPAKKTATITPPPAPSAVLVPKVESRRQPDGHRSRCARRWPWWPGAQLHHRQDRRPRQLVAVTQ